MEQQIRDLVSDGKFFSVEFIKRSNGQRRKMLAKVGVTKYLKGNGASKVNYRKHNLLLVYDMENQGYRSIPLDTVILLKAHGKTYRFQ